MTLRSADAGSCCPVMTGTGRGSAAGTAVAAAVAAVAAAAAAAVAAAAAAVAVGCNKNTSCGGTEASPRLVLDRSLPAISFQFSSNKLRFWPAFFSEPSVKLRGRCYKPK